MSSTASGNSQGEQVGTEAFRAKLDHAAENNLFALKDDLHNRVDLIRAVDHGTQQAIVARESDVMIDYSYIRDWCELVEI